jgi:hypothetical protein
MVRTHRNQWLLRSDDSRADKTFPTGTAASVKLVESWEKPQGIPPLPWPIPKACNTTGFRGLCFNPPYGGE